MTLSVQQKVGAGFVAGLAVLGVVAVASLTAMRSLIESDQWVDRTHVVIETLEHLLIGMQDVEGSARSFVLTDDPAFLTSYRRGRAETISNLEALRRLINDSSYQQRRVQQIEPLLRERLWVAHSLIELRRKEGLDAAAALARSSRGKVLSDEIRRRVDELEAIERIMLERRSQLELDRVRSTSAILALGFLLAIVIGIMAIVVVRHDDRRRRRDEAAIRAARDAADAANHAKSDFLARMSHELRTPLNSIIGFTNVLRKNKSGALREQELGYLERITANGTHLLALINDVLDLSKVEAGRMDVALAPTALDALVRDTLARCEGQLRDRPIVLRAELPQPLATLDTDAEKLRQVLINLIGNAIKFTEHGGITVRVAADPLTRQPIRIDVIDTGIGIPADRLDAIFTSFEQADSGTARRFGGTGLGLAISRSLCELMGYELAVRSAPGQGSTFTIVLRPGAPRSHEPPTAPMLRRLTPPRAPAVVTRDHTLGGKVVLVVDDDSDARLLLSHFIEDCGAQVIAAASAEQGLRMARELKPDLITLDLMMPGVDGWTALRRFKADPAIAGIPVVVVSIVARENRGELVGAVDVLEKPVSRQELRVVLERSLGIASGGVLVVDDDLDARRLLCEHLMEENGLEVRVASDGIEALEVLARWTPSIVILDLMMPRMDGISLLRAMRGDPRLANLPTVVVTAKDLTADEVRLLQQESLATLRKGPEFGDELRSALRRVVRGRSEAA